MAKEYLATGVRYTGEHLRAVAMPLGGIGAGNVSLCGDGGLRQWQLFNQTDHEGYLPHTFFALRTFVPGGRPQARILQSAALYEAPEDFEPAPLVTDHLVPAEAKKLLATCPGVAQVEFEGWYPFARVQYLDSALPVEVKLEAFSPVIPLDEKNSSLPLVAFTFTVNNPNPHPVHCTLAFTLQNAVGYAPCMPIVGTQCEGYGGNYNVPFDFPGGAGVSCANLQLEKTSARYGSMALAVLSDTPLVLPQWDDLEFWFATFERSGNFGATQAGASPQGKTWNAAVGAPFALGGGHSHQVTFLLAWHFPNHYVNWDQRGFGVSDTKSFFYLGNRYNQWFKQASDVITYGAEHLEELEHQTRAFSEALASTTIPEPFKEAVSTQVSTLFTTTYLQDEEGRLFAFEGCCGGSAGGPFTCSGCCPLNCTHVLNYEQTLSRLYPRLERTMRETDWHVQQTPEGGIPHRTVVPLYLPRWKDSGPGDQVIAADGHFGTILKTYREWLLSGDDDFLQRAWPKVKLALDFALERWDQDEDGVLDGPQWNTFDLNFGGKNTFCTSLYLAALRAAEEMAKSLGETDLAATYRKRFESGRAIVEKELWNGEYYEQHVDEEAFPTRQYGKGCLCDQLFGQWWMHLLDLGYLFKPERVKTALQSIYKYNYRSELGDFRQQPRQFANSDEGGLLVTTWPYGGRQDDPMLYCDEVWTGCEYKVASELLFEGFLDEAETLVATARKRYDGRRRSPWNEIECGDHYARPLSSWALLEAASGFHYNAPAGLLRFAPQYSPRNFETYFLTATGWGRYSQQRKGKQQQVTLEVLWGEVEFAHLQLELPRTARTLEVKGRKAEVKAAGAYTQLDFARPVKLQAGRKLTLTLSW